MNSLDPPQKTPQASEISEIIVRKNGNTFRVEDGSQVKIFDRIDGLEAPKADPQDPYYRTIPWDIQRRIGSIPEDYSLGYILLGDDTGFLNQSEHYSAVSYQVLE